MHLILDEDGCLPLPGAWEASGPSVMAYERIDEAECVELEKQWMAWDEAFKARFEAFLKTSSDVVAGAAQWKELTRVEEDECVHPLEVLAVCQASGLFGDCPWDCYEVYATYFLEELVTAADRNLRAIPGFTEEARDAFLASLK